MPASSLGGIPDVGDIVFLKDNDDFPSEFVRQLPKHYLNLSRRRVVICYSMNQSNRLENIVWFKDSDWKTAVYTCPYDYVHKHTKFADP